WSSGDQDERNEGYKAIVTTAMAASQKALDANDMARARYPLLAVSDLCVPSGGYDPQVPEDLVAAYKVACAKAWLADQIPDEKTFDKTVKEYAPKFENVYLNAFYIAENASTYSSSRVFEELAKGASQHPAAEALAIEFAGKAILPEEYMKYRIAGKNAWDAGAIREMVANIYGGPDVIRQVCKESFVPAALESAATYIGGIDPNDDAPQMMVAWAQMVENGYLKWVRLFDPENAKCKELQAKVDAVKQKARELRVAQVKQNRMPQDAYGGDDKVAVKTAMAKVFGLEPGASIVKVVISGTQWEEKPFVWTGINAMDAGWYKLIDAAVLCKYADGTFHVHPVTYGKRWIGGDNYGNIEVRGWADAYEILAQYAK
ncbi:MAG: hypothetical protein WCP21_07180, partial [Armatimonadota bacterium]